MDVGTVERKQLDAMLGGSDEVNVIVVVSIDYRRLED